MTGGWTNYSGEGGGRRRGEDSSKQDHIRPPRGAAHVLQVRGSEKGK